jgi:hypothetical protein
MAAIIVNGVKREVQAPLDTPLLYVLKNDLELSSPQFGCGMAQCGSCSVPIGITGTKPGPRRLPFSLLGRKIITNLKRSWFYACKQDREQA